MSIPALLSLCLRVLVFAVLLCMGVHVGMIVVVVRWMVVIYEG